VIHKAGQIESPSMWSSEFSEDPEKHIVLEKIRSLNKNVFFDKLSNRIGQTAKRKTFMFIHGYNVSFADAAKRTAQIKYDLDFDGEAVLYS
jgi:esterase/lipase superfamily enzyme